MKYPQATIKGVTCDIYDIANAFGVTSPPLFNAFKKIIRRGNGAKTERQDLEEAIQSIQRHLRDVPSDCVRNAAPTVRGRYEAHDAAYEESMRHFGKVPHYNTTGKRFELEVPIPGESGTHLHHAPTLVECVALAVEYWIEKPEPQTAAMP